VSAYVLRVKGYWRLVVRQADGEVVLRTQDAVYAKRHLSELRRERPIERGARSDLRE
jgi:hypothetical protein